MITNNALQQKNSKKAVIQDMYCRLTTFEEKQNFKKEYYATELTNKPQKMLDIFADCNDPKEDIIYFGVNTQGQFIYSIEKPEGKIITLKGMREFFAKIKREKDS
jgi:hypothetical protein